MSVHVFLPTGKEPGKSGRWKYQREKHDWFERQLIRSKTIPLDLTPGNNLESEDLIKVDKAEKHWVPRGHCCCHRWGFEDRDPNGKGFARHEEQHWILPATEQNSRASKYPAFEMFAELNNFFLLLSHEKARQDFVRCFVFSINCQLVTSQVTFLLSFPGQLLFLQ